MIANKTLVEVLHLEPETSRARDVLAAVSQMAGPDLEIQHTTAYHGTANLLFVWGPGHPSRFEAMRQQIARGGHVLACDLAYWSRERKVRISIDGAHPPTWVMRQTQSPERFQGDPVRIANLWHPDGPVIIAGIGPKATVQYGDQVGSWEREMIAACRQLERRVLYKPKKAQDQAPAGVEKCPEVDIERALNGAALLITWHSNAAVDALRLGIPVICRDGAAAAICQTSFHSFKPVGGPMPLPIAPVIRDQFLWNLAWFQWDLPREAALCRQWLLETLR